MKKTGKFLGTHESRSKKKKLESFWAHMRAEVGKKSGKFLDTHESRSRKKIWEVSGHT
jgi:hypothetical protein